MTGFRWRGFISILLSLTCLVVVTTGLVLCTAHAPTTFGIGKGVWKHAHIFVSFLMLIAGVVHFCLNWAVFRNYLWERAARRLNQKWELATAVALTVAVLGVASLGGHADMQRLNSMTLQQMAQQCGKPVDELVAVLKKGGLDVHDAGHSLLEISRDNKQPPQAIFAILQREVPEAMRPQHGGH
jgi:hypothetical protein